MAGKFGRRRPLRNEHPVTVDHRTRHHHRHAGNAIGASGDVPVRLAQYRGFMALLTDDQINTALAGLPGWERDGDSLRRAVKFDTFLAGIDAVHRIAQHAESVDHHPDIDIRWRTVTFTVSTHSEGGITDKDVALAKVIDSTAGQ